MSYFYPSKTAHTQTIGDLFASTIKRWAGIKDYGKIFPGHGGMMDRLDSVLMCGPVVYLCMALALGI